MFDTFGNKVKIKSSPETETKGLAGKTGETYGHTTPTVTGVEVIGKTEKDFALNVYFDDLKESFWFDESLIEQLDNGTEMTLDGVDKKWSKDSNGNWIEENLPGNVTISLLNNKTYWTKNYDINKIEPDTNTLAYQGKIYVLQDPFIFSSAGNLSNLCLNSEQLVSIGETNDLVGGRQTEPLFIKLDNSGLVFRVGTMLDFSGVKNLSDFSHNKVEVRIPSTIEDYYLRTTYEGDIYSQEFLLTHDRLIKYVISQ